ncbi:MAG TPA: hypothetical protein VHP33_03000 [Polyangiaceae bacterium]|nr:hypothetical protein [Polyangiaceae bacterium]
MSLVLVPLALATACGGNTQRTPDGGSAGKASSGGAATAGTLGMPPAGSGGMLGSTGGKPPASAGGLNAPAACATGILPAALEGCRGPDDPGCETCYIEREGYCQYYSGSIPNGEHSIYASFNSIEGGCENGPRCATCLREMEAEMCAERTKLECDCREPPGLDPCFLPDGCDCFCQLHGQNRMACPRAD